MSFCTRLCFALRAFSHSSFKAWSNGPLAASWGGDGGGNGGGGTGPILPSIETRTVALAGWRWGTILVLASAAVAFALRGLIPKESGLAPSDARAERRDEGQARTLVSIAFILIAISILAALLATLSARSTSPDLLLFWGPPFAVSLPFVAARLLAVGWQSGT